MNDKDIIKALGGLRKIEPNKNWKEESRDFLLSKVEKTYIPKKNETLFDKIMIAPKFIFNHATEQAWAVALIVVVLVGGGVSASEAAKRYVKPGDSLYVARILSEKAQVAVTFNKEKKAKLGARLASNRAKQATAILADLNILENTKKAEKLSNIFEQEVKNVKESLAEIKQIQAETPPQDKKEVDVNIEVDVEAEAGSWGIGNGQETDANKVFAVDSEKIEKGIKVYEQDKTNDLINPDKADKTEETPVTTEKDIEAEISSSTEELLPINVGEQQETNEVGDIMDDAQEYIEAKDYDKASEAWQKVDDIINSEIIADKEVGAVKGTSTIESAVEVE